MDLWAIQILRRSLLFALKKLYATRRHHRVFSRSRWPCYHPEGCSNRNGAPHTVAFTAWGRVVWLQDAQWLLSSSLLGGSLAHSLLLLVAFCRANVSASTLQTNFVFSTSANIGSYRSVRVSQSHDTLQTLDFIAVCASRNTSLKCEKTRQSLKEMGPQRDLSSSTRNGINERNLLVWLVCEWNWRVARKSRYTRGN